MQELLQFAQGVFEKTRLRILKVLLERELCVCEVSALLKLSQPRASQHLRALRHAGVVKERREGKWVYYSADLEAIEAFSGAWRDFLLRPMEEIPGYAQLSQALQSERLKKLREHCDAKIWIPAADDLVKG